MLLGRSLITWVVFILINKDTLQAYAIKVWQKSMADIIITSNGMKGDGSVEKSRFWSYN